jgi:hypothetical protein
MELIELRRRAFRAYELGRAGLAAKSAAAALVVGLAGVGLGRPLGFSAALSAILFAVVGLTVFRGGAAGRAVWPALAAGAGATFLPLAIRTAGCTLFGPECMRLCLPGCVVGGCVMGVALALTARHEESAPREFLIAGTAIAALAASIGCSLAGASGIIGMGIGTVAAGAPILLVARAGR